MKNYTIHYWIEKGANSRKIVLGVPLYGQSFTLSNPQVHGLNARSSGPGVAGQFTRSGGFLAYYEVRTHARSRRSFDDFVFYPDCFFIRVPADLQ